MTSGFMISAIIYITSAVAVTAGTNHNVVSIKIANGERCITTNSIPDHAAGPFRNGTVIKAKSVKLCVTTNPVKGTVASPLRGAMGVALNGIQFKPKTSGYFDPTAARGNSRRGDKNWSFEIASAPNQRGLDKENAHVGKVDSYHYHGVPVTITKNLKQNNSTLVGYAADGFEIHYIGRHLVSGYKLKLGNRPSNPGPGGPHDGTYSEDFEYISGLSTLDKCNMGQLSDKNVYFVTDNYPFVPRCLWGEISSDFIRRARRN